MGSHVGRSIIPGGIPCGTFHNPGWDPTWKRRDPTWDTPGIPGGNGGIPPHIFTWVSPVIKRAKNSTAFTSFFYKKVESKRFPWQEFKWQMLVFVGFHPILWCMTLKSLRDICVIFFFTGIRDRSGDFIIRPEGENFLQVDLKNIINPSTPSSD